MKKFVSVLAAGALLATLLAGCGANSGSSSAALDSSAPESSSASEPASESTASGTGLKFGLGLVTEMSGSDATAEKDGKGEADVTAAGIGEDGKATDADLAAGCTVGASAFVAAAVIAATVA